MISWPGVHPPIGETGSMDLSYSAEYEAFPGEVKAFLAAHGPLRGDEAKLAGERRAALLRERAIAAGYLARAIPRRYGGSEQPSDVLKAQIIREEFAKARAPGEMAGIGPSMLVPVLLEKGAGWQEGTLMSPTVR